MTNMIKEAIEVLRDLPDERQEIVARAILDYASHDGDGDDDVLLSSEQVAEVERRIAQPNREFLSLNEVHNRLRPFGV